MSDQQKEIAAENKDNKEPGNKKADGVNPERAAIKRARWRMLWKLCAVLAALLAYISLKGIEGAKSSYDEERSRSVVIVNDSDANQIYDELRQAQDRGSGQERAVEHMRYHARLLKISDVEKVFDQKPPSGSSDGFNEDTLRSVREAIEKIKYQSFKDENEIVGSLNEAILADAEYRKRSLLATEEAESKALAGKLPELSQDETMVKARLEEMYRSDKNIASETTISKDDFDHWISDKADPLKDRPATETEINKWRALAAGMGGSQSGDRRTGGRRTRMHQTPASDKLDEDNLLRWLAFIEKRSGDDSRLAGIKVRIDDIDKKAQEQIRAVYTELQPALPGLIKGAVNAPHESNSWLGFFNPRSVLDEKSGVHVIYQTLWLTCVMVLIFGLIFLLLLLLRPLPFVARGTDTLMEHAGELFKRSEGAGPQLAKSLAVTAAALGVGAAVAVAGSNAVSKKPRGGGDSGYAEAAGQGDNGQPGARGRKWKSELPEGGGVVEHIVKLSEPIVSPSPVTITVTPPPSGSLDPALLNSINAQLTELWRRDDLLKDKIHTAVSVELEPLKTQLGDINVKELSERTNSLSSRVDGEMLQLNKEVNDLTQTLIPGIEKNYQALLSELQKQLKSTNDALTDLRDSSFERQQNSGGRSLLTRAIQVFRENKHLSTSQSLKALKSIMIKSSPPVCQPPAEYSCDLNVDAIIRQLASMIGDPPQSESDFMKRLRAATRADKALVSKTTVDQWKAIILKYTRVAY